MAVTLEDLPTILVVSPHLDDGVLSVGGLVERAAAAGVRVIIATPFTGDTPAHALSSPLVSELHQLWNLGDNPFAHRPAEDAAALAIVGAELCHGGLVDALYRTDHAGAFLYPDRQSVFGPPAERDNIYEALVPLLSTWLDQFMPDLVLAPLGVGQRVDHIITTTALRQAMAQRLVKTALYEDIPYATGLFPVSAPDNVDAAIGRTSWPVTGAQIVPVELQGKLKAIAAYGSQIPDIFPDGVQVDSVLGQYMRQWLDGTAAERIWHTARGI